MTFRHGARILTAALVVVVLVFLGAGPAAAHEITVKGTVAKVERARIQVKTGEEKQGQTPAWYPIDAKTKIQRDKTAVSFDEAKIKTDERVVLIVDHEADGKMKTLEIRLAAK